jgi:hypothetical protein
MRSEAIIMTSLSRLIVGALALSCAASAFAQPGGAYDPSAPKTRAQVRQEFLEWRAAGYDPQDWLNYPENAIAAGRIVAQRRAQSGTH